MWSMCEWHGALGSQADLGILNFRSIKEPVRTKHLLVYQMFKEKLLCAGNELGAAEPGGVKTDMVPCLQEASSLTGEADITQGVAQIKIKYNCHWHDQGPGALGLQPLQEDQSGKASLTQGKQAEVPSRQRTNIKKGFMGGEGRDAWALDCSAWYDTGGHMSLYLSKPTEPPRKTCVNYRPSEIVMCHSAGGGCVWGEGIWELCVLPVQFYYEQRTALKKYSLLIIF